MRKFIALLIVFASFSEAWAEDAKPDSVTFGFDIKKVEPPDAKKGEPVARIFYDYIYPTDLKTESKTLNDIEARQLLGMTMGKLRQKYIEQKKITATKEEVQQYVAALSKIPAPSAAPVNKEEFSKLLNEMGSKAVEGWKCDRALYKEYGGTVIFQQGNPMEPVGAYRKFLEKMDAGKVFEIYDKENHAKFWHYVTQKHGSFEVPPARINFDVPWWLQKPDEDGDSE